MEHNRRAIWKAHSHSQLSAINALANRECSSETLLAKPGRPSWWQPSRTSRLLGWMLLASPSSQLQPSMVAYVLCTPP